MRNQQVRPRAKETETIDEKRKGKAAIIIAEPADS
jgi:hypothetical protein